MVNLGEPRAITAAISPSAADIDRTSVNSPSTSCQRPVNMHDLTDTGGSWDDYAGNGSRVTTFSLQAA